MTAITVCPQCTTHFKITQAQSEAHHSMVRCGHCRQIFNAVEHSYSQPEQLDLPLMLESIADATAMHPVYNPNNSHESYLPLDGLVSISQEAAARITNDFSHLADVYVTPSKQASSPQRTRLWALGSVVVTLVLIVQVAFFFRDDIAARLPGVKPAMQRMCAQLNCILSLPKKINLLNIESSELESDPTQASVITLHALLRSRASYAMSYPHIELTLTDTLNNPVARRNFGPADYLLSEDDKARGIPANRESSIKLHLNTGDLKPAGYNLFLFYPN